MIYLFIGGNSDGETLEVEDGKVAWHVTDKVVPSLAVHEPSKEPRGSWTIVHYFAAVDLSDEEAFKRFFECNR